MLCNKLCSFRLLYFLVRPSFRKLTVEVVVVRLYLMLLYKVNSLACACDLQALEL